MAALDGLSAPVDVNAFAQTAVHESLHYLGLYHTTEQSPGVFDPLLDTPMCDATTIKFTPSACPDATNVMFPLQLAPNLQFGMTGEQGFVVTRNPTVAAEPTPTTTVAARTDADRDGSGRTDVDTGT